jgi:hypothetical protein
LEKGKEEIKNEFLLLLQCLDPDPHLGKKKATSGSALKPMRIRNNSLQLKQQVEIPY